MLPQPEICLPTERDADLTHLLARPAFWLIQSYQGAPSLSWSCLLSWSSYLLSQYYPFLRIRVYLNTSHYSLKRKSLFKYFPRKSH